MLINFILSIIFSCILKYLSMNFISIMIFISIKLNFLFYYTGHNDCTKGVLIYDRLEIKR